MNVYGLAPVSGACHWYRIREPLRALAGLGHMTAWGELFDESIVTRHDTILTHILHGDDETLAWRYLADAGQHRLIYDIDDNIWQYPKGTDQHNYWTPERRAQVEQNMRLSHLITTPSFVLADKIAYMFGIDRKDIEVLPNCIPRWALDIPRELPDTFTIGYQGAPQKLHQADLDEIQTELFTVLNVCPDARLLFFGQPKELQGAGPFAGRVDFLPWQPDIPQYYRTLPSMTVGIAPLTRSPFTDCKSSVRAVELQALGIPGVYADSPAYRGAVVHGATGYIARIKKDWITNLVRLYKSPELVRQVSIHARRHANDLTIESNAVLWEQAYHRSGPGMAAPSNVS